MKIETDQYNIYIYKNELKRLEKHIKKIYKGNDLFVITDSNVYKLYNKTLIDNLTSYNVKFVIANDKSLNTYDEVIHELLSKGIKRDSLIVSFGGGTVGDLAGFVASTLLRGINYVQIPTTLLAQVDSSIGGKTAIDLDEGKNLVGSFYNPKMVFIDTVFLETLTKQEYINGFAEAFKIAIIKDEELYNKLRSNSNLSSEDIKRAIELKYEVVKNDPFDRNERRILNFGHTYGHAIEQKTNYSQYKHGEAISYGMLMALELGVEKGITPLYLYEDIKMVLLKNELVIEPILERKLFTENIKHDKKSDRKGVNFIFLKDIGSTKIVNLQSDELWNL